LTTHADVVYTSNGYQPLCPIHRFHHGLIQKIHLNNMGRYTMKHRIIRPHRSTIRT